MAETNKSQLISEAELIEAINADSLVSISLGAGQPQKNVKLSTLASVVAGLLPVVSNKGDGLAKATSAEVGVSSSIISSDKYYKVRLMPQYYYGVYLINCGNQVSLGNIQSYILTINNRGGNSQSTFRGIKLSGDGNVNAIGYHRESNVLYLDFKFNAGAYPFIEVKPLLNYRSYTTVTIEETDTDKREGDLHI